MKYFTQKLVAITLIVIALIGCKKDDPSIEVSNLVLDKEQITLTEGGTEQLTATVLPEEATDKTITWTSSDETIATVDDKGEVTAVKAGTATITVTTKDGNKKATCTITVNQPPKITMTTTKAIGEKIELLINAEATDQAGVWIDLNNNGKKDDGEAVTTFDDKKRVSYIIGAQTITIYGKITYLFCVSNQLNELDVSKNTALTYLYCGINQLTELDISQNTALEELKCFVNQLTQLDVTKNTKLEKLHCSNNQLQQLDVSKNIELKVLQCYYNQLQKLDVTKNIKLTFLSCVKNQLQNLDVSKNTALTDLSCGENQLSELDISKNTALTYLYCNFNQLSELDISKNTALTYLSCGGNQLSELDISKNTALEKLYCYSNQLTQLDISKNKALHLLWCYFNDKLTKLNVANGNNKNFKNPYGDNPAFNATNCPKLTCIKVDNGFDPAGQTGKKEWKKDATASWHNDGTDCP